MKEEWTTFFAWMKNQEIETIIDFGMFMNTKYDVSQDKKHVRESINNEVKYYEVREERYGRTYYNCIDEISVSNWRKCVAELSPSREFIIHSPFPPIEALDHRNKNKVLFDNEVIESII